jgi:hypothetical protein
MSKTRNVSIHSVPSLTGYKVPYKGRRYWVIEIENDRPFDFVSKELSDFAVLKRCAQFMELVEALYRVIPFDLPLVTAHATSTR